jgi:hypothetical protein
VFGKAPSQCGGQERDEYGKMRITRLIFRVTVLGAERGRGTARGVIRFAHWTGLLCATFLRTNITGERELRCEYQKTHRQCGEPRAIFFV